jgi:hypothetical protein
MTGTCHHIQLFSVKMGFGKFFGPGWPGNFVLWISTSRIAWKDRHMWLHPVLVEMRSQELFAQAGLKL